MNFEEEEKKYTINLKLINVPKNSENSRKEKKQTLGHKIKKYDSSQRKEMSSEMAVRQ